MLQCINVNVTLELPLDVVSMFLFFFRVYLVPLALIPENIFSSQN